MAGEATAKLDFFPKPLRGKDICRLPIAVSVAVAWKNGC